MLLSLWACRPSLIDEPSHLPCNIGTSSLLRRCRGPSSRLPVLARALSLVCLCLCPRVLALFNFLSDRYRTTSSCRPRGFSILCRRRGIDWGQSLGGLLRGLHYSRLGLPARIGLGGQHLDPRLAHHVVLLFVEGRGFLAGVPQPLMPLRVDLDLGVVRRSGVVDDASPALAAFGAAREAELPVCVALEVIAYNREPCKSTGRTAAIAGRGRDLPIRKRFRHGRRRVFHLYHACAKVPMRFGAICKSAVGCRPIVSFGRGAMELGWG